MTKAQVWAKFCEVNPSFVTEQRVEMSVDKIRKMVETAYNCGFDSGFEYGKQFIIESNEAVYGKNTGSGKDMFDKIFGNLDKK